MSGVGRQVGDLAVAHYADGTEVQVGDRVLIERGRTPGIVEWIVVAPEQIAEWRVGEPGLLLLSEPFGRVFWSLDDTQDPVIFVERGAPPPNGHQGE